MSHQETISELLISSWLRLTTVISKERIVSNMPYNETIVYKILYQNTKKETDRLTATDLCKETKMLKSSMNRTLNSMEEKGLIHRIRSKTDKRNVYIELNKEKMDVYLSQHAKIVQLVDTLIEKYGKDKAMEIYKTFEEISDIAQEVMK